MKYFFFDIDGTLVSDPGGRTIPESTKTAIEKLKEKGFFLAIATGRSQAKAVDIMHALGFVNMVSDGGNGITINDEFLGAEPLDKAACQALEEECRAKGIPYGFSPENAAYRVAPDDSFAEISGDTYLATYVKPGCSVKDYPEIYKMYVAGTYPVELGIKALAHLPWCRYSETYFFVEPTEKSRGIRKVVDYYHGDYKDVVVFGDGKNDLSMFTDDWTCIAMGNACDELKAKATYITTDVTEDGIYNACRHFGWID